ncbi:prephenate dehydratase [Lignipirellula cremea]|uniref:Bifunctional chorismate mutase/prephenate dehydratase n=1 Tax=Lignipirellula cremea TaxID=2528010 RepID=A0A518DU11_9BACT|nr:prephenate dehydratase [Lignipirellula cremea]QDU95325.1 P-protein [Lignipirellula cremea]
MAKRKSSLAEIDKKLDRLDRDLVKLLSERTALASDRAEARQTAGQSSYDPDHEQAVIEKILKANKGPLAEPYLRGMVREMLSGSRQLAKPLNIVYLGPQFSYSHLAAIERFGANVEMQGLATIAAVFEAINRRQADYGIVPIENSTDGRVVDTLGMFARLPVQICGEVQLRIHHYLLGMCSHDEVREVYSKPQALSQCRNWISKHLPGAKVVEVTSTAAAARLAAERPGIAAVASRQAGVNYGLRAIAEKIEDNPYNLTRFAVIGSEPGKRTGNDKTAAMFQIPHEPGALADAMAIFKRGGLNLTWIESFPVHGPDAEYLFFVEMEGHRTDAEVTKALAALEKKAERLEVLGSYQKATPVD